MEFFEYYQVSDLFRVYQLIQLTRGTHTCTDLEREPLRALQHAIAAALEDRTDTSMGAPGECRVTMDPLGHSLCQAMIAFDTAQRDYHDVLERCAQALTE